MIGDWFSTPLAIGIAGATAATITVLTAWIANVRRKDKHYYRLAHSRRPNEIQKGFRYYSRVDPDLAKTTLLRRLSEHPAKYMEEMLRTLNASDQEVGDAYSLALSEMRIHERLFDDLVRDLNLYSDSIADPFVLSVHADLKQYITLEADGISYQPSKLVEVFNQLTYIEITRILRVLEKHNIGYGPGSYLSESYRYKWPVPMSEESIVIVDSLKRMGKRARLPVLLQVLVVTADESLEPLIREAGGSVGDIQKAYMHHLNPWIKESRQKALNALVRLRAHQSIPMLMEALEVTGNEDFAEALDQLGENQKGIVDALLSAFESQLNESKRQGTATNDKKYIVLILKYGGSEKQIADLYFKLLPQKESLYYLVEIEDQRVVPAILKEFESKPNGIFLLRSIGKLKIEKTVPKILEMVKAAERHVNVSEMTKTLMALDACQAVPILKERYGFLWSEEDHDTTREALLHFGERNFIATRDALLQKAKQAFERAHAHASAPSHILDLIANYIEAGELFEITYVEGHHDWDGGYIVVGKATEGE